jgi:hypothetical protein
MPNPGRNTVWTSDQDARLATWCSQSLTSRQISAKLAEEFGVSFSRNAVISHARRLKLPLDRPKSLMTKVGRAANNRGRARPPTLAPDAEPFRCAEVVPLNLPLIELEVGMCRYPFGDTDFTFCGLPAVGSYCSGHQALCWRVPYER